jgi:uncharacterized ferredoxin-like protein
MPDEAKCPSCGVPFVDHLGLTLTCAILQQANRERDALAKGNAMLMAGMESQSERMDGLKQEVRSLREVNAALLAACKQSLSLSQHADGCRWWDIPVATMNDSERSQAEQHKACDCHLKACRVAVALSEKGQTS